MRNYFFLWVLLLVDGVSGDEVKVPVTDGDSVTLPSSTVVERNDQILWKFKGSIIVNVEEAEGISNIDLDGRFRGRLELDKKTGSLNITKVTSGDAGLYQLDINNKDNPQSRRFSVTVHNVETVSKMERDSFSLNIGDEVENHDPIQWKFGGVLIAHLNNLGARWSNIHPNDQTGELQFKDIRGYQFGDYEANINTSRLILHRKFSVTVGRSGAVSGISGASVGLMVWAVTVSLLQKL